MDLGDITQLALVATVTLVFGRIGWAFARLIDRRASRQPTQPDAAAERIRTLEDEQLALRQELVELQERQVAPRSTTSGRCCGSRPRGRTSLPRSGSRRRADEVRNRSGAVR